MRLTSLVAFVSHVALTACSVFASEPMFRVAFDGGADAVVAGGKSEPIEARGLEYAPGVDGQAVRMSAALNSSLAYSIAGNVLPEKGTVSLWVKREWGDAGVNSSGQDVWRTMFTFPDPCKDFGSGALSLWWQGALLRYDLTDLGHTHCAVGVPPPHGEWEHLAFSWSEEHREARMYLNGHVVQKLPDDTGPMARVVGRRFRDQFTFDRKDFDRFFVGCLGAEQQMDGLIDDFRVYPDELGEAEVRGIFEEHSDKVLTERRPDYAALFAKEGPNPYVGGEELGLEFVAEHRFNAASMSQYIKGRRFRSVGDVVEKSIDGERYLEAGTNKNDRFAFMFDVDPSVPLYCFDFVYPDDAKRTCDLIVQFKDAVSGDYALQVGYFTGDEYPNTGKMLVHRCLYWTTPGKGGLAVVAMTARTGVPAALAALRIYRVKDAKLPPLAVREPKANGGWNRMFGMYWEDPAIGYDFATGGHGEKEISDLIDRTVAYMKYCGENIFCYPGVWYQGLICDEYNPRHHARDFLGAWYEKFDREGLFFVPNVNPNNMDIPSGLVSMMSMTNGTLHSSPIAIHDTGKPNWGGWHNTPPNFNFLHPDVQAQIERHIDALLEQGAGHPSFKGVCMHLTMHCMCWFGDIRSGYNDYAVRAFAKDTGLDIPIDESDPLRGRASAQWIRENAYEKWVQWRCDKVTAFYSRMAEKLRTRRPDLKLWLNSFIQPNMKRPDFMEDGFVQRQAREGGLDRVALAAIPNLVLCQTQFPAFCRKRERQQFPNDEAYAFNRVLQTKSGFFNLVNGARFPWINQHDLYWENPVGRNKGALNGDGFSETGWRVTTLNPSGYHALRDFVLPLRFGDVLGMSKGGFLVGTYGMEDHLRKFAAAYRALPAVVMDDVAQRDAVVVRQADWDGKSYFYVVNTDCAPVKIRLRVPEGTVDLSTGRPAASTALSLELEPYQLVSFSAPFGRPVLEPPPENHVNSKGDLPDPALLAVNKGRNIVFENPLPRMHCGNVRCGTYNNMELSLPGVLTTSDARLGMFLQKMRETIMANRRLLFVDGKVIVCNHNWIRDHVHQMKGWKHWEYDPLSFLQYIIDTQRADGQFFELVKQMDDYHWTFVGPESSRLYPDDNVALVRLELEADVEYLVVEGAWQYYRMTGDDNWLASVLPALEKGINYQTSDPMRWEESLGLCIRPYTIDTWDFTSDLASGSDRRVVGKPLCAMHGDNTGVYQAMNQLAWFNDRLGNSLKAASWRKRAEMLRTNTMKHLWNGQFFVHQLPVRGAKPMDSNEANRLSLSDAYALNRGILSGDECRAVIDAFIERGKTAGAFSEFFTIDPAYEPAFNRYKPGEYVNGAISPFTAGELAKGAFKNGREKYGWDVISRWIDKIENDKAIYFLYNRTTGAPISEGAGPSAWGAAAFLDAIEEGLAGIVDAGTGYDVLEFSPRWCVTPYTELRYVTGYELTRKYVDVRYIVCPRGIRCNVKSPAKKIVAHVLLPEGKTPRTLLVNGEGTPFEISAVGESKYVDFSAVPENGAADMEILY